MQRTYLLAVEQRCMSGAVLYVSPAQDDNEEDDGGSGAGEVEEALAKTTPKKAGGKAAARMAVKAARVAARAVSWSGAASPGTHGAKMYRWPPHTPAPPARLPVCDRSTRRAAMYRWRAGRVQARQGGRPGGCGGRCGDAGAGCGGRGAAAGR